MKKEIIKDIIFSAIVLIVMGLFMLHGMRTLSVYIERAEALEKQAKGQALEELNQSRNDTTIARKYIHK